MSKTLQRILLALGVIALVVLLVEIGLSLAATLPGSTPARVVRVNAGPYPLIVSLYKDPANAGFALPFTITTQRPVGGSLSFDVSSLPDADVDATPVHATLTDTGNGAQGNAEITVQGGWVLQVNVTGSKGQGTAYVPITATAPPAIPVWLGWLIGLAPLYGLFLFLLMQHRRKKMDDQQIVVAR